MIDTLIQYHHHHRSSCMRWQMICRWISMTENWSHTRISLYRKPKGMLFYSLGFLLLTDATRFINVFPRYRSPIDSIIFQLYHRVSHSVTENDSVYRAWDKLITKDPTALVNMWTKHPCRASCFMMMAYEMRVMRPCYLRSPEDHKADYLLTWWSGG
jgi:hypothetical protein